MAGRCAAPAKRNRKQQAIWLSETASPFTTPKTLQEEELFSSTVASQQHYGAPTSFPSTFPTLPHCTAPARLIPSLFFQACPASCSPGCILQGHIPPYPLRDERQTQKILKNWWSGKETGQYCVQMKQETTPFDSKLEKA